MNMIASSLKDLTASQVFKIGESSVLARPRRLAAVRRVCQYGSVGINW